MRQTITGDPGGDRPMTTAYVDQEACPYLRPGRPAAPLATVAVYCGRPGARVHVPTHDELATVCAGPWYVDCGGFRRAAANRTYEAPGEAAAHGGTR
jgi:hypothetical protein